MSDDTTCQFECVLPLERQKAFELVIDHPQLWWVTPFSDPGEAVRECGIEPHPGGVCYEIGEDGRRRVWGTILSIEEPLYVRLAWQVSPAGEPIADPAAASRVVISFRDAGDATRLELVHSEFLRHGEDADHYRNAMASAEGGWQDWLKRLQKAAASRKKRR
jgi:uncharacterized protein YndB with AHSA1/START domain